MNPVASAALTSWSVSAPVVLALLAYLLLYLRGWLAARRLVHRQWDYPRLAATSGGLLALFLALESPLNAFDSLFLSAHMTQHLLLLMLAPPLLLLGKPAVPLLRGLPKAFVKEALGPFLTWHPLHATFSVLTSLPAAWLAAALSTIIWHLPATYELALSSPVWHGLQHACFFWTGILFWWPVIPQSPGKPRYPQWALIPYLLFGDLVNTALSALFVFSGRVLYPSYEAVPMPGLNPVDDQALAGAIMWVPGSLIYLLPAFVLASRLLNVRPQVPELASPQRDRKPFAIAAFFRSKHWPALRRGAQWLMLALAAAVVGHGLLGPQTAPFNLAGVLPWIHWRALSVLALLTVGNLFCMSCPFTLVRDLGRKVLPARLRWPHALRNKWLPIALLLVYLWAYEAFSLWSSPWATAWIIVAYFAGATLIDGFFRGASFCKYVCPIGQFHFVTSLVSPREVAIRSSPVCHSCRTHDCIRGNSHSRGCELDLFQPKKSSNLDCTFCMDCVKACPHDNITLVQVLPASTLVNDPYRSSLGRLSKRNDWAALVLLIVFGAFTNAAGMIEPVMMLQHRAHAMLGPHAMPLVIGAFVVIGSLLLPAALVLCCGWLNHLAHRAKSALHHARRFVFAFTPLGASMWAAHLSFHFWSALPLPPDWLTPLQILLLDAGTLLTLYLFWTIAHRVIAPSRNAWRLVLPWAVLALALYALGLWILFQPMQMRGTMMMH